MTDRPGPDVPADLLLPPGGTGPGVVVFQEIFGVTDYIRSRAQDLADLGYVVLVPHLYARLGDPVVEEGGAGLPRAMELLQQIDWDQAVADGLAAMAALRSHGAVTGGVGLVGFCLGGGLAFAVAARADEKPDALVSYYGSALPDLLGLAPQVPVPSLHHFGEADSYVPLESVREVERAVTAWNDAVTFQTHAGAGHAFDNPSPTFHHPQASAAAWATTAVWLGDHLPAGAVSAAG